jgi:RHS repeat-associated protein
MNVKTYIFTYSKNGQISSCYSNGILKNSTSVSYIWNDEMGAGSACQTTSVSRTRIATADNRVAQASSLSAYGISQNAILTSLATSTDIHENVYTNMTFLDAATATKWQITTSSMGAGSACQKTIAGYPVMTVSSLGATNTFTYDGFARQVSSTTTREASPELGSLGTPANIVQTSLVTSNFYNSVGQLSSTANYGGCADANEIVQTSLATYEYNSLGRTVVVSQGSTSFQLVASTTNEYNAVGQLIHQYGSTYPVAYEFDSQGRKISMMTFSDPNNPAVTQWLYDEPTGLLTNKVYDDGNGPTYSYYPNGQLKTRIGARGLVSSNAYNIAGQLVSTTYSDGTPSITKQYNRLGQPVIVTDAQGTRTFNYDTNTFVLISESINGTNTISYSYNSRGQQTGYNSSPNLGEVASLRAGGVYTYDSFNRLATMHAVFGSETNTFHFNYLDGSAMVSSITNNLGFGVSKYYEDNRNLIVGVSNYFGANCISAFEYQNDALGRRSERLDFDENLVAKTNSFAYNQHQEIDEVIMGTNEYIFTYDDIGNRTEHLIKDIYARYENNNDSLNRYSDTYSTDRVYNKGYDFDADGNMTNVIQYATPWDTWQYTWNAENRMTSARNTQYGIYVTYAYDYQGRMFEKVTNGVTNNFIWAGNHIISEMTDSATNYYTWANGETLTASIDGEPVFYCHDANKNVTDLVDDSGDIVVHYKYSPFGVRTTTDEQPLAETNPFGFSNEYFDETTGQVEFLNRKYFPQLGKFASRDPIGVQGGPNEYGICGNDLINHWDNWGLATKVKIKSFVDTSNALEAMLVTAEVLDIPAKCEVNFIQFKYVLVGKKLDWQFDVAGGLGMPVRGLTPYYYDTGDERFPQWHDSIINTYRKQHDFISDKTVLFYDRPAKLERKSFFYLFVVKRCCVDKKSETVEILDSRYWTWDNGKISQLNQTPDYSTGSHQRNLERFKKMINRRHLRTNPDYDWEADNSDDNPYHVNLNIKLIEKESE